MSWLRAAPLMAAILLAGCVHGPLRGAGEQASSCSGDPLAACTRQPQRFPAWMVGLTDPAAPVVGRTIALVKFRKGHLARSHDVRELVAARLEPLDIILVSSRGRLTGNVIPGLFTHTVVNVGSEAQLRQLGMWNRPKVRPLREAIASGKSFIEADRKGVHLSPIEKILDTDRVLVLRPRMRSAEWTRQSLCRLLDHVGSRFDFHFDAGKSERLFCSELPFHVLPDLQLPTRVLYGREVVLPDDVAAAGLSKQSNLSFVLYLRGGPDGWTSETRQTAASDLIAEWKQ